MTALVPVPVPVPALATVSVSVPVTVPVSFTVPVTVQVPVPVAVTVTVPVTVPVPVAVAVTVPVTVPVPVPVAVAVTVSVSVSVRLGVLSKEKVTEMSKKKLQAVVVRAYSGVFFGYMATLSGGPACFEVALLEARHIWSWTSNGLARKALTVEDIAILGAGAGTKISGPVSLTIADVKVIVFASEEAAAKIEALPCLC